MSTIYFISGLGADERVFRKLELPGDWEKKFLSWIEIDPDDTLESYSRKYIPQINTKEPFILAGLSFGGMIVTELSKVLKPELTFVISSITCRKEMPGLLRFLKRMPLYLFAPIQSKTKFLNKFKLRLASWHLGANSEDEKKLISDFINGASPRFIRSAIKIICNWENDARPSNIIQINGDADKIFTFDLIAADYKIAGGGHFMVYNKAEELSRIMSDEIRKIEKRNYNVSV